MKGNFSFMEKETTDIYVLLRGMTCLFILICIPFFFFESNVRDNRLISIAPMVERTLPAAFIITNQAPWEED